MQKQLLRAAPASAGPTRPSVPNPLVFPLGHQAADLANHRKRVADQHGNRHAIYAAGPGPGAPAAHAPRPPAPEADGHAVAAVATAVPGAITATSAVLGGHAPAGGAAERGVVYSASAALLARGRGSKVQIGSGPGKFARAVSLSSNTTYHVRAYAVTAAGVAYGRTETFDTLAPLAATAAPHPGPSGATAGVTVAATGGAAPYAYSWRNTSSGITLALADAAAAGLAPGNYTVTVTDGTGATTTVSFTLA